MMKSFTQQIMTKAGHSIRVLHHHNPETEEGFFSVTFGLNAINGNTYLNKVYREWTSRKRFNTVGAAIDYGKQVVRGATRAVTGGHDDL